MKIKELMTFTGHQTAAAAAAAAPTAAAASGSQQQVGQGVAHLQWGSSTLNQSHLALL